MYVVLPVFAVRIKSRRRKGITPLQIGYCVTPLIFKIVLFVYLTGEWIVLLPEHFSGYFIILHFVLQFNLNYLSLLFDLKLQRAVRVLTLCGVFICPALGI